MDTFPWILAVICVFSIIQVNARAATNTTSNPSFPDRDSKFLPFMSFVSFDKMACPANDGSYGTCYNYYECKSLGGYIGGHCAQGLGVCCVTNRTCQGVIFTNNTYFVNQGYPAAYTTSGQCSVTINRLHHSICQLRLDFESFSVAQPEPTNHKCLIDNFSVKGTTAPVPVICGDNAGQHMYLDIGYNTTKPITLNVQTNNPAVLTSPLTRSWKIRVTQIPCHHPYRAPSGCLQYFTGTSGILKSFNFNFDAGSTTSARELANQDYSICLRQELGTCGIKYNVCQDNINNPGHGFTLTGSYTSTDVGTTSATDSACSSDYLSVSCGTNQLSQFTNSDGSVCASRLCGGVFTALNGDATPASVYSYSVPYELRFHTDGIEANNNDQGNLGFCLNYEQLACSTSRFPNDP